VLLVEELVLSARRFLLDELEELLELLSLSLLEDFPILFPWATYEARHTHALNQKIA
jgi:hypothetical protein